MNAVRVVKLGGSLLDLPNLVPRLREWLAAEPPSPTILVVGGGDLADAIRAADRRHAIGERPAHWLCVRAMTINAEMMLALLPEARLLSEIDSVRSGLPLTLPSPARGEGNKRCDSLTPLWILEPWHFLRVEDAQRSSAPLPDTWDVTSDSIAARVAELVGADELVLLKSTLPSKHLLSAMATDGYVDRFFPHAAAGLARVRFVSLRGGAKDDRVCAAESTD